MTFDFNKLVTIGFDKWKTAPFRFYGEKEPFFIGNKIEQDWRDVILSGNTALTLVNAKADSLEYLKLFGDTEQLPETYLDTVTLSGGCEQRNLPSGHQELTYLQGDGTAYIEPDVVPTNNTGMKIVFEYGESGGSAAISGVYDGSIPRQDTFFVSTNSGSVLSNTAIFIAHRGDTLSSSTEAEVPVIGKTYTALINYMNNGYIGFEGFTQKQLTTLNDVLSNKVLLFARLNYNNSNITASACKIKYVEFTEGTEVIRKYYPDRYNNMLGLYDTITNTFLTNKNSTGTFTAGADVVPTPDTPMDIVCNNGVIKVSPNLYNPATRTNGYYISASGVITEEAANVSCYSALISVKSDTTYVLSGVQISNFRSNKRIHAYDTNGNWIQQLGYQGVSTGDTSYSVTVTTTATTKFIRISILQADANVQIEQGSTATTYMPYGQIYVDGTQEVVTDSVGNTANAERLLAVGTYKDTQEVLSGAVSRSVSIKVLDGSEDWLQSDTKNDVYRLTLTDAKREQQAILSTHFIGTDAADVNMPSNSIKVGRYTAIPSYGVIAIRLTDVITLADFKQFLANQYSTGTPVIVVYPTDSATTKTVTGQSLSKSPVTQTAGSISNLPIAITESGHTVPTPQQPLQINCNNGVVKVRHQSGLPLGYTQVEYLGSDSQAYIDTGISGGANDLEIGGTLRYTKYVMYGAVYGNWIDDTSNVTRLILGIRDDKAYLNNNRLSNTGGNSDVDLSRNTIHTFVSQYTTYTIDGITETVTQTISGTNNNNNIALFNRSITNPNTSRDIGLEVSSFYIKKGSTLVRNLIPARRNSDNVLGMYDLVSNTFLTNQGTGSFTAGNTVSDPIEIYTDGTVETVEITGKNLFDTTGQTLNKYIDTSGNEQDGVYPNYSFAHTDYIKVQPNTIYTFAITSVVSVLTNHRIMGWTADKTFIQQEANLPTASGGGVGTRFNTTFTTGATTEYITINYVYNPNGEQPQLELGSTATTYEPYTLLGTATAENLFKVGDYQDEFILEN